MLATLRFFTALLLMALWPVLMVVGHHTDNYALEVGSSGLTVLALIIVPTKEKRPTNASR